MNGLLAALIRELNHAESQLSELDGPLAAIAKRHAHEARLCVETMVRLEERRHVLGERAA